MGDGLKNKMRFARTMENGVENKLKLVFGDIPVIATNHPNELLVHPDKKRVAMNDLKVFREILVRHRII